jgi:hypothetical protein
MTPNQVDLIRASWTSVDPIQGVAGALFYDRLFELDPALRRLFRNADMAQQKKILMQTLTVVVKSLDRLDQPSRPSRRLAAAMPGTVSGRSTTRPWGRRSCGRSARTSATPSPPTSSTPGRKPIRLLPRS